MNLKTFAAVAIGVLLWYAARPRPTLPEPPSLTKPLPPKRPHAPVRYGADEFGDHVGGPEYNGQSIKTDLPADQHLKNKGGKGPGGPGTGSGLCVFTSLDMAARWKRVPEVIGFRDYMTNFPGGGYPGKVSQYVKKLSKERGRELIEGVDWGQSTAGDISVVEKVLDNYGIACITYGYSPRYGQNIAHMVCIVMLSKEYGVILDNNFPGTYEWVERKEAERRWKIMGGGWVVWFNSPPPPPVPVNE